MEESIWKVKNQSGNSFRLLTDTRCLQVNEQVRMTSGDVHPGWVRATSILLKGMERLRLQELAEAAQTDSESLPLNPACLSFSQ